MPDELMIEFDPQHPRDLGELKPDERVNYKGQGVCRVVGFEVKEIAGQSLELVRLEREEDGAVVLIPRRNQGTTTVLGALRNFLVGGLLLVAVVVAAIWLLGRNMDEKRARCRVIEQHPRNATVDELVWAQQNCR